MNDSLKIKTQGNSAYPFMDHAGAFNIKSKYSHQLKTQRFNQPWDRDLQLKTQRLPTKPTGSQINKRDMVSTLKIHNDFNHPVDPVIQIKTQPFLTKQAGSHLYGDLNDIQPENACFHIYAFGTQ